MNSYNKKNLDSYDYCELGHNPNCGDEMHLKCIKYASQSWVCTFSLAYNGGVIREKWKIRKYC